MRSSTTKGNTGNGVGCQLEARLTPRLTKPGRASFLSLPPETRDRKKSAWARHQSFQWVPSWIATIHINVLQGLGAAMVGDKPLSTPLPIQLELAMVPSRQVPVPGLGSLTSSIANHKKGHGFNRSTRKKKRGPRVQANPQRKAGSLPQLAGR